MKPCDAGGSGWRALSSLVVALAAGCFDAPLDEEVGDTTSAQNATATLIADAIDRVNARAASLRMRRLTESDLRAWFDDWLPFAVPQPERGRVERALAKATLPSGYDLVLDAKNAKILLEYAGDGREGSMPVIKGDALVLYTAFAREACTDAQLCTEPYHGSIPSRGLAFPSGVELRIAEARAPGACLAARCDGSVLDIRIHVTPEAADAIATYFGQGFGVDEVNDRMRAALSDRDDGWIPLQALFGGWVAERSNTFPRQGDNDVCHGPARQFFHPQLRNGRSDRSTEPVAILLKDHYCMLEATERPSFGDYLYVPGRHSGRFVLTDPVSGRDISFSIQSGGFPAYRFWWADEDFSGKPFARMPLKEYRARGTDVWRRCR